LFDEVLGRGFPATAGHTALVRAVANVRWAPAALGDDPDDDRWVTDPAGREKVYRMVEGVGRDRGEWPGAVFPWSLGIVLKLFGAHRRGERYP
jgi:hypothetical protein